MASIRSITDTNDETVYPQTVPSAVTFDNGLDLQAVLDSLVHIGDYEFYTNFGDIKLSLNPKSMIGMNMGDSRVKFTEPISISSFSSGDLMSDIIGKLSFLLKDYKKLRSYVSNPNILINSNFKLPVNQRGLSTYTINHGNSKLYTIDHWLMNLNKQPGTESSKLDINDGYITMSLIDGNNSSELNFYQSVENPQLYNNVTITSTITYRTTRSKAYLYVYYETKKDGDTNSTPHLSKVDILPSKTWSTKSITVKLKSTDPIVKLDSCGVQLIGLNEQKENSSIELLNAKTECSEFSTKYNEKPYSEEVRACQRYFYRVKPVKQDGSFFINGRKSGNTEIIAILNLPVDLYKLSKTAGSYGIGLDVKDANSIYVQSSTGGNLKVKRVHITSGHISNIVLAVELDTSTEIPDVPYNLILKGNSYIDFSSEID